MQRHQAEQMFLVKRTQGHRDPKCTVKNYIKLSRKPQGYQRYHTSKRGTIAIQLKKRKQRRLTSLLTMTTLQELHRWALTTDEHFLEDAPACFCSSAWWVRWGRTKLIADAHLCNSCYAMIVNILGNRSYFLFQLSFLFLCTASKLKQSSKKQH